MSTDAKLLAAARSWEGTPFCERAAIKGSGVCCHKLMSEILNEAFGTAFDPPNGDARQGRFDRVGEMTAWFRASKDFAPAQEPFQPGDILLIRTGVSPNHMVMILPEGLMVHVGSSVVVGPINRRFLPLLRSAWRLVR